MQTDSQNLSHLTILSKLMVSINACTDEKSIYQTLAEHLPKLVPAERASVCLLDEETNSLSIFSLIGKQGPLCEGKRLPIFGSLSGQAINEGRSKRFSLNHETNAIDQQALKELGFTASLTTPIYRQGKVHGTLNTATCLVEEYDDTTVKTLEAVASITSACLDRQSMHTQNRDTTGQFVINQERLNVLAEITPKLSTITDLHEAFKVISEAFCSLLPINLVSFVEYNSESHLFSSRKTFSPGGKYLLKKDIEAEGSAMELVLQDKAPMFYKNLADSPHPDHRLMAEAGLVCSWFVPVYSKTEIVGVLIVAAKNVPRFHADLLNRASIMGNMLGSARDRILSHRQLEKLAYTDSLTGLPNRAKFNIEIDKLLESNENSPFTLCLLDFNNFKELNDQYGHPTGDKFLQVASDWLRDSIDPSDFVARLGGDEFAILSKSTTKGSGLNKRLHSTLEKEMVEMRFDSRSIGLKFSVGIVQYPIDATEKNALAINADLALYAAKSDPSDQIRFYTKPLSEAFQKRVSVINEFSCALDENRIIPFYQPIVDLNTGKVAGLEALIRWLHPTRGLLFPSDFYDIFDDPQSCRKLGNVVLDWIAIDIENWRKTGVDFGKVAINIEPANLTDDSFFTNLLRHIGNGAFRPEQLTIEITENSALRHNNTRIIQRLQAICDAGFSISLDDFGTGYSSISHIKSIPVTAIKLDKSYVSTMRVQPCDHVIVKGLVSIAIGLNIDTVAEGVESLDDCRVLFNMGCEKGQGFYFSDAVPANDVAGVIHKLNMRSGATTLGQFSVPQLKNSAWPRYQSAR